MEEKLHPIRVIRWAFSLAWKFNKKILISCFFLVALVSLLPAIALIYNKSIINALESRNVLKVYIHADTEFRRQRAVKEYGIPTNMADSTMTKYDKKRKNYYNVNTGKKWNDWSNYDMILDSGKLGLDVCVRVIQAALE